LELSGAVVLGLLGAEEVVSVEGASGEVRMVTMVGAPVVDEPTVGEDVIESSVVISDEVELVGSFVTDSVSIDGMTQQEPKKMESPQTPSEVPLRAIQSNVNMQTPDSLVDLFKQIRGRMASTFSAEV